MISLSFFLLKIKINQKQAKATFRKEVIVASIAIEFFRFKFCEFNRSIKKFVKIKDCNKLKTDKKVQAKLVNYENK